MRCAAWPLAVVLVFATCLAGRSNGADPPAGAGDSSAYAAARWGFIEDSVARITVYRDEKRTAPLHLHPEPIKRLSSGISDSSGGVFLWTADGRPAAVVEVFFHGSGLYYHNFESLFDGPLFVDRDSAPLWTPREAGITMAAVDDVPAPSTNAARRLSELKAIARRFTGEVISPSAGRNELRLHPAPLYRYGQEEGPINEGALFVLVLGTGPEVALLIESASADNGPRQWRFGLTRMNPFETTVFDRGRKVWSVPRLAESPMGREHPEGTFFTWKLAP